MRHLKWFKEYSPVRNLHKDDEYFKWWTKKWKKYSSLPFHYKIPKKNNELPRVGKRKT
jgi:hypothetical protein